GSLLSQYGMQMLHAESDAPHAMKEILSDKRGNVRLAVLPSDLDFPLVPLFVEFQTLSPATNLKAYSTIFVWEEVLSHKMD
ncbi:LysR family transcriptional regulator, partial [Bacillus pumilus]